MIDKERVQAQIDQNERDQQKLKKEQERLEAELKKLHEPKHGEVRYGSPCDPIIFLGDSWFASWGQVSSGAAGGGWDNFGKLQYNIFDKIKEIG